jgi:hypothetical protein
MNIPNATYRSFRKGIEMLNIIVQSILKKKDVKERDPKRTPKTLMPPITVQKHTVQDPHIHELNT